MNLIDDCTLAIDIHENVLSDGNQEKPEALAFLWLSKGLPKKEFPQKLPTKPYYYPPVDPVPRPCGATKVRVDRLGISACGFSVVQMMDRFLGEIIKK